MLNKAFSYIVLVVLGIFIISCQDDEIYTSSDAHLQFSVDTILFDTIFTTIGSATKRFTVKNPHDKTITISSIRLAGGDNSPYRLNIDGFPGNELTNIELKKKDSLYIFVEVTIDPLNQNNPLVVNDSIVFVVNTNVQDIDLVSYGQDVHLINGEIIETTTWTNDKPYLVYNDMGVDENNILTVEAGTRVYFHRNSRMYIAGSLIVNGTIEEPVIFNSDRLEDEFKNIPGQWDGIWLVPGSHSNVINHAEIKNAIIGIQVDTFMTVGEPTLVLTNSKIENMTSVGLFAQGAIVEAYNNVIANCGLFTVALSIGGEYTFNHCTFANYFRYSTRVTPSLYLNNYYYDTYETFQPRPLIKAYFGNCIIYGNRDEEILFELSNDAEFNYYFENCLLRVDPGFDVSNTDFYSNNILNIDPDFVDPYINDFQLDSLSRALDAGKIEISQLFPFDILGNSRLLDYGPDIGAYEHVE